MKSSRIGPEDVSARAQSPLSEPALLQDALALAGAHAFEMGEDGHLGFAQVSVLERYLVSLPGGLATGRADWEARMEPDAVRTRRRRIASLRFEGARYRVDYAVQDDMGQTRHVREIGEAIACADGRATLIRGVVLDRTDAARSDAAIAWQARHDPLTRLRNRDALLRDGAQMADLATRVGVDSHLLRLRLSNLGDWTLNFGEELRDTLLKIAADRMQSVIRTPDCLARLDGDDFALATTNSDPDSLAQMLRAAITAQPCQTAFGPLSLEVTFAIVPLDPVETALGGTRDALSDNDDGPVPLTTPEIDVIATLSDDQVSLAFQPIVHAATGELHHHECLLRLRGPDGRMESAFRFILAAEKAGLVHQVDLRALDLALPHLLSDETVRLALNVSAGTIADDAASAHYISRLRELGDACSRLTLEMTETLAVDDPAKASRFSAEVRSLGCQFAVDDFGSGHTSFRNLLAIEADSIKIDGSLVRGVAVDENKQAFIRMLVDLAATFSVQTVAEMVENKADAQILTRLGVNHLQGYYFGRPAPSPVWSRMTP